MNFWLACLGGGSIVFASLAEAELQSAAQALQESHQQVSNGDLDAAMGRIDQGLAVDPAYGPLWKQKARIHQLRNEPALTLDAIRRYLLLNPKDAEGKAIELQTLLSLKDIKAFDQALSSGLSLVDLQDAQGVTILASLLRNPEWSASVAPFLDRWPGHTEEIRSLLGTLRAALPSKDATYLPDLRRFTPQTDEGSELAAEVAAVLGDKLALRGKSAKAIPLYELALRWNPSSTSARRELGWAYRHTGKPIEAADQWEKAWEKSSNPASWLNWIVAARLEAKQWAAAREPLKRLLERAAGDTPAQAHYLVVLTLLKQEPERTEYAARLKEKNPQAALLAEALLLKEAKEYAGALEVIERGKIAVDFPEEVMALRRLLASKLIEEKKWDAAEQVTLAILKESPSQVAVLKDLGWLYWSKGNKKLALTIWEKALKAGGSEERPLVAQITERLLESGAEHEAIQFYDRWSGLKTIVPLGLTLIEKGRFELAGPVFEEARNRNDQTYFSTVYEAYGAVRVGNFPRAGDLLKSWIENSPALPPTVQLPLLLPNRQTGSQWTSLGPPETFELLDQIIQSILEARATNLLFLIDAIDEKWGTTPFFQKRLAGYQATAGKILAESEDSGRAKAYLEKSLQRDPHQPEAWVRLAELQKTAGQLEEPREALNRALREDPSPAFRKFILGEMAFLVGDEPEAITHWSESLKLDPKQDDVRSQLIHSLVDQGRLSEAKQMIGWFEEELARGNFSVRKRLAAHKREVGDLDEALALWEELAVDYPQDLYFSVSRGRLLFQMCRAQQAIEILEPLLKDSHDEDLAELLCTIGLATNQKEKVIEWSDLALSQHPANKVLWWRKAEAADGLGRFDLAEEAARAYLKIDPETMPVRTLLGRALVEQEKWADAREVFESLLATNPEFQVAMSKLREVGQKSNDRSLAEDNARALAEKRPWDPEALIRLAISLAENQKFAGSFAILRSLASRSPEEAVPVLFYQNVTTCDSAGQVTLDRWKAHVRRLAREGYRFLGIGDLALSADQKKITVKPALTAEAPGVLLVVSQPEPGILDAMNETLSEVRGQALLVLGEKPRSGPRPGTVDQASLQQLKATGRWQFGVSDFADPFVVLDSNGRKGGFWTHVGWLPEAGRQETAEEASQRWQHRLGVLQKMQSSLESPPQAWFYPRGDYGQLALDTNSETLLASKNTIQAELSFEFAQDEGGFLVPFSDPSRLGYKAVPPDWDEQALIDYLKIENPLLRDQLELAKVTAWNRQHERANRLFQRADSLGARQTDLHFYWGTNAYYQGDVPASLDHLRRAVELDPLSERARSSLEQARWKKHPLLEADGNYWEDSDNRRFTRGAVRLESHVTDRFSLRGFAARTEWETTGAGREDANEFGGGLRWYLAPEYWIDGQLGRMTFDSDIDGFWGFNASFRGPIDWLRRWNVNGSYEVEGAREQVDTLEAVRDRVLDTQVRVSTYQHIADVWELFWDGERNDRTDGNVTLSTNGRLVRRLHEWPFLGFGYAFRFADSDRNPPEYFAPKGLQQHQAYAGFRGDVSTLGYALSVAPGYANESNADWRFVWSVLGQLRWEPVPRFFISVNGARLETPSYDLTRGWGEIGFRF